MKSNEARASVMASQILLDRGWGKSVQPIAGEDGKPSKFWSGRLSMEKVDATTLMDVEEALRISCASPGKSASGKGGTGRSIAQRCTASDRNKSKHWRARNYSAGVLAGCALMEKVSVTVPHIGWSPRPHQQKLWEFLQGGGKRAMAIWHRRAGKDEVCLHHTAVAAFERVGNYWHCLPEFLQGRKAIWTAINAHTGKRRIDEAFPKELRTGYSEAEMFIRFHNSTFQIIGSDTYDSTVGASVAGIVYSEFALANPSAWAYHRPILEENNGWAAFVTTPRGRNFAHSMFQFAAQSPDWFVELLTVKDTGALTDEALAETLKEYKALYGDDVGDAQYRQEYFCDWNAAILGGYFTSEMATVRKEERIIEIVADDKPMHRAWDLGVKDDTSIWWFQISPNGQLLIHDHYAASGVGVEHYAERSRARKQRGWRTDRLGAA